MTNLRKTAKHQTKIGSLFELNLHIGLLRVLGICPFYSNSFKSKMYALFLMVPLLILSMYEINYRYTRPPKKATSFDKTLIIIVISSVSFFILTLLLSNLQSWNSWKELLRMLVKFDATVHQADSIEFRKKYKIIRFILIRVIPLIFTITFGISWKLISKFPFDFALFLPNQSAIFFEFQIATFMLELAYLTQSRYQHIQDILKQAVTLDVIANGKTQNIFNDSIAKIKYKYGILHKAIEEINTIFSWIMLSYCSHVIIYFQLHFYTILYAYDLGKDVIFTASLINLLILVSQNALFIIKVIGLHIFKLCRL